MFNRHDSTVERKYIETYRFLMKEYELVKAKKHPVYRLVEDLCKGWGTNRKTFLKYYNRYKQSGKDKDLLPQKRGPKYKTRRPIKFIENKVIELRQKGNSKLHNMYMFNIPATKDICGRICPGCYSIKEQNRFPIVIEARNKRLEASKQEDFASTIISEINSLRPKRFD